MGFLASLLAENELAFFNNHVCCFCSDKVKIELYFYAENMQSCECELVDRQDNALVKVSFIVNSATCTVHTYRELKLRYSLTPWCIQITLNTNSRMQNALCIIKI